MVQRVTYKIGDEELILETGRLAKQANGAVYAQFGGSAVLATVCSPRYILRVVTSLGYTQGS